MPDVAKFNNIKMPQFYKRNFFGAESNFNISSNSGRLPLDFDRPPMKKYIFHWSSGIRQENHSSVCESVPMARFIRL